MEVQIIFEDEIFAGYNVDEIITACQGYRVDGFVGIYVFGQLFFSKLISVSGMMRRAFYCKWL
jgi:hypothetical protein